MECTSRGSFYPFFILLAVAGLSCASSGKATRSSPLSGSLGHGSTPPRNVREVAAILRQTYRGERARAVAAYNFVRDEIQFGFRRAFDDAKPDDTLRARRGHCNPQAALLVALLRELDIPARQHFVTISRDILSGLFPPSAQPPQRINHSYVEVKLGGSWIAVDGYILDTLYQKRAQARLREERKVMGYGAHRDGCNIWNGKDSCMAQLVSEDMVLVDHGSFPNPEEFYRSDAYVQRLGSIAKLFFAWFGARPANRNISSLRSGRIG